MKKLISEVEDGLESLLGERVVLWCMNYIYSGKLVGVNSTCVLLTDAGVVYETGELTAKDFTDFQELGRDLYVQTAAIEAFYAR